MLEESKLKSVLMNDAEIIKMLKLIDYPEYEIISKSKPVTNTEATEGEKQQKPKVQGSFTSFYLFYSFNR